MLSKEVGRGAEHGSEVRGMTRLMIRQLTGLEELQVSEGYESMEDIYNLERFVKAQGRVMDQVLAELRKGRKTSHWMWFIFPQIHGLGNSPMAREFAVSSIDEAKAYLAHETLGPRLRQCTELVNSVIGRTIHDIFGSPDDLKFRSCMTLFAEAATGENPFSDALRKYFAGKRDQLTMERL